MGTYAIKRLSGSWNYGIGEIARLVRDLGAIMSTSYGVNSSTTQARASADALKNPFYGAFSYTSHRDFNFNDLLNEMINNRPVILDAVGDTGGHVWVCDGLKMISSSCGGSGYYVHMNWGWNGNEDGWYKL